jgi:hypothetical protein
LVCRHRDVSVGDELVGLAALLDLELDQLLGSFIDELTHLPEDPTALPRSELRPTSVLECLSSCLDRPIDVLLAPTGDGRNDLLGGGVQYLIRPARCRLGPLAVDEHAFRIHVSSPR